MSQDLNWLRILIYSGVLIGVLSGVFGTYRSYRKAGSDRERGIILKYSIIYGIFFFSLVLPLVFFTDKVSRELRQAGWVVFLISNFFWMITFNKAMGKLQK